MTTVLFPRLGPLAVDTLRRRAEKQDAAAQTGLEHLDDFRDLISIPPTGGHFNEYVLSDLNEGLRAVANATGFPDAETQQARAAFDRQAAIWLAGFPALRSGEALRDDVWAFQTCILFEDIVAWRFDAGARQRYHGGVRNALQRLWMRGTALDRGSDAAGRWELLETLSEDAMVQIFERASLSSDPSFARAIAEAWRRASKQYGRGRMEEIMRRAARNIRIWNEIRDLRYLRDADIDAVLDAAFGKTAASLAK